jgi:cytochrome P450
VVEYDPYSDAVLDDPHPVYRALREQSPVHYLAKYDAWALSRFEDIWSVSTDAQNFSARSGTSAPQLLTGQMPVFPNLNHLDPPAHAELRKRLWQFPEQRRELVENPALIPAAFDEVLRFDMPTQFLCRTLLRDVELRGVRMRAGRPVLLLYPSGNRDPREFRDPDRFDIHRRAPRILSFGHGVPRCLGIHFAKLEGRVMLEEMLARWPDDQIEERGIRRERTEFVQGFRHLPIRFSDRGSA